MSGIREHLEDSEQHRERVEAALLDAIQTRVEKIVEEDEERALDEARVVLAFSEAYRNLRSGR